MSTASFAPTAAKKRLWDSQTGSESLLRLNRIDEVQTELARPIENLSFSGNEDRYRAIALLGNLGHLDRATRAAYRQFLEVRSDPQAWLMLSRLVLGRGELQEEQKQAWDVHAVAQDVAVDIRYDDGAELFFVVEPNETIRRLDGDSWEPSHPLISLIFAQPKGARFTDQSGKHGTIVDLRHKIVARFHYILKNFQIRFPKLRFFWSISVSPENPGGLDELLAQLRERQDWLKQQVDSYTRSNWPLGMLAEALGVDSIEASIGVVSLGATLKVAVGSEQERNDATRAVIDNDRKGCVLDLLGFWNAWHLGALPAVEAIGGRIHLCRSTVDRLHARREALAESAKDGIKSAAYNQGRIELCEVLPEVVQRWRADLDRVLAWINEHAEVMPVLVGDELNPGLREHLRATGTDIFHSLTIAIQQNLLLVTDDLLTRQLAGSMGFGRTCWSAQLLGVGLAKQVIDFDEYVRWLAYLVEAGHNYLSVSSEILARAHKLDATEGAAPGQLFRALSRMIGGAGADPASHIRVTAEFLGTLWFANPPVEHREAMTSLLMSQLMRERHRDYIGMVGSVIAMLGGSEDFIDFMRIWVRGHFLPEGDVWTAATILRSRWLRTIGRLSYRRTLLNSGSDVGGIGVLWSVVKG